jgi:4a-hydroxytetrahydrobiopterin dehydratase
MGTADEEPASKGLSRTQASRAAGPLGWRYILGTLCASVPVASLGEASTVAAMAVAACGPDADAHLRVDLRPDRVELSLQARGVPAVTSRDVALAEAITTAVAGVGAHIASPVSAQYPRPVQTLELAIDAMDIPAIRPFWRAVLGYGDEPGHDEPEAAVVDPAGQGPALWFQQMDVPRPQRNRIHFDVTVADDEARPRVEAALAAGGTLVSDEAAPSFWVLADAEGNEACVCTWLARDERGW